MFTAFSYVTGPNQRNLAQKVQKKKVGRFGVTRPYYKNNFVFFQLTCEVLSKIK